MKITLPAANNAVERVHLQAQLRRCFSAANEKELGAWTFEQLYYSTNEILPPLKVDLGPIELQSMPRLPGTEISILTVRPPPYGSHASLVEAKFQLTWSKVEIEQEHWGIRVTFFLDRDELNRRLPELEVHGVEPIARVKCFKIREGFKLDETLAV